MNLATLLADYREDTGSSFADIATRTGIPRATVAWIGNPKHDRITINPESIDALSAGLNIPHRVVTLAAIESAGFSLPEWQESVRWHEVSDIVSGLSDEDWRLVRSLIMRLSRG